MFHNTYPKEYDLSVYKFAKKKDKGAVLCLAVLLLKEGKEYLC